jgi:hypothetical protein
MSADVPLTELELAFRRLIAGTTVGDRVEVHPKYRKMCAEARQRWEQENLVWHYGYNVWGVERPKPELAERLSAKGQLRWMRRVDYDAQRKALGRKGRKDEHADLFSGEHAGHRKGG